MISDDELLELEELIEIEQIEKARESFWNYCLYMDYGFFKERESVLKDVADAFQQVESGELKLLYVAMPPRTGKSYITSQFCAWGLGRHPQESIMRNTYSAKLAGKFSNDIKTIMQSDKYNNIFPDVAKFRKDTEDMWEIEQSRHGVSYFCAGVGGPITGFGCTLAAILDDSIKNEEDAMSPTMIEKKWNWYTSTHLSRLEKGCPEIHIATRWSKKDIPGRLIDAKKFDSPNAKMIVLPALVNGESFCPAVKTTEEYMYIKSITPNVIWQAEFMQRPIEAEGQLFAKEELKYFKKDFLRGRKFDGIISWGDVADEGSDYLSCPIGYILGDNIYIPDVVFTQDKVEISKLKVVKKLRKHKVDIATFESNAGGKLYALEIARILNELGSDTVVKWRENRKNKETRIFVGSEFVKQHFYFLEDGEYKPGSDYDLFMTNITEYSHMGKNIHDDAPDSINSLADLFKIVARHNLKEEERGKSNKRSGLV